MQGPPGTGKSATIVGMVLQMWGARCNTKNKAQMPRILLVAPSNAAVDELARKLLAVKSQLPEDKRFKIIRIGERWDNTSAYRVARIPGSGLFFGN